MKKLFLGTLLLALAMVVPVPAMARVDVNVNIGLPPVVFAAPPDVIVMPDSSDVYVVPDIDAELFFWDGWWWRPWQGRWYRSHYYDRGWGYYSSVPSFYYDVDPGWRGYYRDRNWYGHRWNYERIPHQRLNQNWKSWKKDRHWERQKTWGIESYQPRPQKQIQELRQQRQKQYQQRPEVQQQRQPQVQQQKQQAQEKVQRQQRQPQVQQQKQQPRENVQQKQKQPKVQQQKHSQPQGKPEIGEKEKQDRK
jgi:hypothetical protein